MAEKRTKLSLLGDAQAQQYLQQVQAQPVQHPLARRGELAYVTSAGVTLIATRLKSGHIQLDYVCAC